MGMNYRASADLTCTLASLASSAGLTVGRCSAAYSNATNKDDSLGFSGLVTTGSSTLVAGAIEVWAFAQRKDSTWPEIFTSAYAGSDGGFTVKSRDVLQASAYLVGQAITDTTARGYALRLVDLVQFFGFSPQQVALFVTQSSGQALDATAGNHVLTLNPAYWA